MFASYSFTLHSKIRDITMMTITMVVIVIFILTIMRRILIAILTRDKICMSPLFLIFYGAILGDNGSDEEGCTGKETCPHGTFQCLKTKDCLPEQRFCNAIADCPDQSDEKEQECRMEFQPSEYCPFR